MAPVVEAPVQAPPPCPAPLPPASAEQRRPARRKPGSPRGNGGLGDGSGDWWRVAAMVAAVLCGSALMLFALVEWAAGM